MSTPPPVSSVFALTPYTCALACLESFFLDIERPLDQCEMLKKYPQFLTDPDPNRRHEYGAASDVQIVGLCSHLGYKVGLFQDFRQGNIEKEFQDALDKKAGVLIMALWDRKDAHCVRLSKIKVPGVYEVMSPSLQKADLLEVTFPQLISWNFRFIIVSL